MIAYVPDIESEIKDPELPPEENSSPECGPASLLDVRQPFEFEIPGLIPAALEL